MRRGSFLEHIGNARQLIPHGDDQPVANWNHSERVLTLPWIVPGVQAFAGRDVPEADRSIEDRGSQTRAVPAEMKNVNDIPVTAQ